MMLLSSLLLSLFIHSNIAYDCKATIYLDSYGTSNVKIYLDGAETERGYNEYISGNDLNQVTAVIHHLDGSQSLQLESWRHYSGERFGAMKATIEIEAMDENG